MNRIKMATVTALLAAQFSVLPLSTVAADQGRRDRYEDRWDRRQEKRERREWKEERRERREAYREVRQGYWDPARSYRQDYRGHAPRRMGRNDYIYRGSDDRYYCKRDDGTTGLIIGGIAGGVLGHVIAPGGSKTLGTIIGAGAGALLGRAVDDGDVVCR